MPKDLSVNDSSAEAGSVILLVEDDAAITDATTMLFEAAGYLVVGSPDASSALDVVNKGCSPHLIVTDYRMPGLSGVDLIQRLRSDGIVCPCILLTGAANTPELDSENLENCVVLTKPVDPDKLLSLIDELIA